MNTKRKRDRGSGRYAHETLDLLCVCGHTLALHTAERVHGEQPCIVGDYGHSCDCISFKRAKVQDPALIEASKKIAPTCLT